MGLVLGGRENSLRGYLQRSGSRNYTKRDKADRLLVLIIDCFFQLGPASLDLVVEITHDSLKLLMLHTRVDFTSLTHSSLNVSLLRSLSGFPAISCIPKD